MSVTARMAPRRRQDPRGIAAAVLGALLLATPRRPRSRPGTILGNVKDSSGAAVPAAHGHRHQPRHAVLAHHDDRRRGPIRAAAAARRQLQGRSHADRLQELLADRHPARGGPQRAHRRRRSSRAASPRSSRWWPTRRSSRPTRPSLSRTVGQNEVLNLPAGQPRPLLAAQHHRRRDQQRELELARRPRAAHDHQRLAAAPRSARVNFQLDGGNNTAGLRGTGNPAPNPEAVQEFRVITNNYAAEYGRYPAGIVDVVTKSGTNQFHGAVFEFFRNEKLNAKRWAPPGRTAAKDPLDRNQYGAALGGPIQQGQDVLLRRATPACARRRPTTGTPPSSPPRSSGRATSRSPRSSRGIR